MKKLNLKELSNQTRKLKLLYVEDEIDARENTVRFLSNFFTNIVVAVDGQDGLEKFKNGAFDIILTDINMPTMNGLDMIKNIRDIDSDIPILILSAYSESEYFLKSIEYDVDGYVLKPLAIEQFKRVILKVVKKIDLLNLSKNYQRELEEEVTLRNLELKNKLYFDELTSLYSRYIFFKDIQQLHPPIILLLDINKFKIINEVYGSEVGTKVLVEFSKKLSQTVEEDDYKLYRISADEFALLDITQHIDTDKYENLIEKLFDNLNNLKLKIDDNEITIDITLGLSTVEENSYDSAKIALDFAKETKKAYVMYSTAIDHRRESCATLEQKDKIVQAISEQRVIAVFQPIVNIDGKIVKYETLMRLRKENSSDLVTPYYFLDIAIKTRLYEALSTNIIYQALFKLRDVKDLVLSINFTYTDIKNKEFIQDIYEFIVKHPDVGQRAVFEITESESMGSYDEMKLFIKKFRKLDVKFAIDDFGSGFSNFEYILEIEPNYLKIDGSLIKDIDTDDRAFTLVEAIVEFSHKLGILVIAEFVHSKIVYEKLRDLGVDEYQGFYFYKPQELIVEK